MTRPEGDAQQGYLVPIAVVQVNRIAPALKVVNAHRQPRRDAVADQQPKHERYDQARNSPSQRSW
jgi:hypothetical protein